MTITLDTPITTSPGRTRPVEASRSIRQRRRESTIFFSEGRGWIVGIYDHERRVWMLSHEMPWASARQARTDYIRGRDCE